MKKQATFDKDRLRSDPLILPQDRPEPMLGKWLRTRAEQEMFCDLHFHEANIECWWWDMIQVCKGNRDLAYHTQIPHEVRGWVVKEGWKKPWYHYELLEWKPSDPKKGWSAP